jgi:hypothetical protein
MSFRATKKNKNESYLDIDLKELFGGNVPDSEDFRNRVGQEIIDIIQERTQGNKFLSNAKQSYSEDYADSLEFAVHGKSKGSVNLTQSGDMLNLMQIIESNSNRIRIGWTDAEENKKATNHNFGVTVPRREFLGLTRDESKDVKSKFREATEVKTEDDRSDLLRRFVLGQFAPERLTDIAAPLFNLAGIRVRDDDG